MSLGMAILTTIGLWIMAIIIGAITGWGGFGIMVIIVIGTSIWAAIDASKINSRKYKTQLADGHPAGVFFGCLLLWIVVFPWYLVLKGQIKDGKAELKDQYKESIISNKITVPFKSAADVAPQLEKLAELKAKGILTEEEFNSQKEKLLS